MVKISSEGLKNLPKRVIIGVVLGVIVGILLGDDAKYLQVVGQIYTMLLEVAVYPYIMSAIILSLASLSRETSKAIFKDSWLIYIFFIFICYWVIFILSEAIPASASNVIIPHTSSQALFNNFIDRIVPKNIFSALTNNEIPAIIFFCCILGLSLQGAKNIEPLLKTLDSIKYGCLTFWNVLILASPYAVFAMISCTIGTTNLANLNAIFLYLILITLACVILSLLFFPLLMSCIIDMSYKDILLKFKDILIISLSSGAVVVAIPYIESEIKKYIGDDENREQIISTLVSLSFPIALVGNFCIFIFIIFAATYYQYPIDQLSRIILVILSFFSSIGSPSSAPATVEFLANWQHLPDATVDLFVELMSVTRYPQVLASVMGIVFLAFTISAVIFKKSKIRVVKLVIILVTLTLSLSLLSFGISKVFTVGSVKTKSILDFELDQKYKTVQAEVNPKIIKPYDTSEKTLDRIKKTGVIRVGYNPFMAPFSYFNNKGDLVGYDVSYIYQLARDLGVKIIFIPFKFTELISDIQQKKFDIAIGSILVSSERLQYMAFTVPNYEDKFALLVRKNSENDFLSLSKIEETQGLQIGVFDTDVLKQEARLNFKNNQLKIIEDTNSDVKKIFQLNAMFWTYSHSAAFVKLHAGYSTVIPEGLSDNNNILMAFVVNRQDDDFLHYLNYWLEIKSSNGFRDQQYKHWILGQEPSTKSKNWNIFKLLNKLE